ncbi:MAG: hypothetical protein JWO57_131 [Pseudonocardiales bacterium]|nr:hypothetical protein [Pseudonocardiales bacterium]
MSTVPINDAATVVLLRDGAGGASGAGGIEAWLLTRVTQMAFAAGMTVFPGGRVEPTDADLPIVGAGCTETAARFGCDESLARALIGAAVRETFEETSVLLTAPPAVLPDARSDVEQGRVGFGDFLREHGLSVDADGLHPWARWITPAGESPRRYDTRFFLGALPDGAAAQDVTSEASAASWIPVGVALEQAQRGELMMLPPTLATLASLVPFATVAEAMASAAARTLEPINPIIRITDDGQVMADLPDGSSITVPRRMTR